MQKKLICIITFLLCINTIHTTSATSLTQRDEAIISNALLIQHTYIGHRYSSIIIDELKAFLKKNNIDTEYLYDILVRKKLLLDKELADIQKKYPSWLTFPDNRKIHPFAQAISIMASAWSSSISAISFVSRLIINYYASPSTPQKIADYGLALLGTAALIDEIWSEYSGQGYIVNVLLPHFYEKITNSGPKKETLHWISHLIWILEENYPELSPKKHSTFP